MAPKVADCSETVVERCTQSTRFWLQGISRRLLLRAGSYPQWAFRSLFGLGPGRLLPRQGSAQTCDLSTIRDRI